MVEEFEAKQFESPQEKMDKVIENWRNSPEVKVLITELENILLVKAHKDKSKEHLLAVARTKIKQILEQHSEHYNKLPTNILRNAVLEQITEPFVIDAIERLEDV